MPTYSTRNPDRSGVRDSLSSPRGEALLRVGNARERSNKVRAGESRVNLIGNESPDFTITPLLTIEDLIGKYLTRLFGALSCMGWNKIASLAVIHGFVICTFRADQHYKLHGVIESTSARSFYIFRDDSSGHPPSVKYRYKWVHCYKLNQRWWRERHRRL